MRIPALFLSVLAVAILQGCQLSPPTPFPKGEIVDPPFGLYTYSGEIPKMPASRSYTYDELQEILFGALAGHKYIADDGEQWTNTLHGDCEDFAIQVQHRLAARGIPSRLVFAEMENGGLHVVAEVDGWVLDNRSKWVLQRDIMPYRWISMGVLDGNWYSLKAANTGDQGSSAGGK